MILEMIRDNVPGREDLQHAIDVAVRESKCLVFFENGPGLRHRLEEAIGERALFIPLDDQTIGRSDEVLVGMLQRVSQRPQPLSLILVGHSGGEVESAQTERWEVSRGYERWVDGATRVERQLQESKARFAARIDLLVQQLAVAADSQDFQVQLQVIFYQASAGLFWSYEWDRKEFRHLLDN